LVAADAADATVNALRRIAKVSAIFRIFAVDPSPGKVPTRRDAIGVVIPLQAGERRQKSIIPKSYEFFELCWAPRERIQSQTTQAHVMEFAAM
jgi:hypothetical protein